MIPDELAIWKNELFMLGFLIVVVYATVKSLNILIMGIPDEWEYWLKAHKLLPKKFNWFTVGFSSTVKRLIAGVSSFWIAYTFKFTFVSNMFSAYNKTLRISFNEFANYLLVGFILLAFSGEFKIVIEGVRDRIIGKYSGKVSEK